MKLIGLFLLSTLGYVCIYVGYTGMADEMKGRIGYTAASVVGTLIGSTLGKRWFK